MLNPMTNYLIRKDLYFNRTAIISYTTVAIFMVVLIGSNLSWATNFGSIALITIVIAMGFHMIVQTVVSERTEHTLPFIMSLPISTSQYTTAKLVANSITFIIPWFIIVGTAVGVILVRSSSPNGLIPYTVLVLVFLLVSYFLYLCVAMITESLIWTGATIVLGNLLFQGFTGLLAHIPSITQHINTNTIVWSAPVIMILAAEMLAIIIFIMLTFYVQGRKKDFL